jgi:hypothetical protein
MTDDQDKAERPRYEPELIPPDRDGQHSGWRHTPFRDSNWRGNPFGYTHTTQRVYMTRLGPFGIGLVLLAIAAIVLIVVIAAIGAVLIWVPVIAAVLVIGALMRFFRGGFGPR